MRPAWRGDCTGAAQSVDVLSTSVSLPRPDSPRRPHLPRLRAIVRSRMWKWLFDAHRLFGVAVDVLDDQFEIVVPSRDGRRLREIVEERRGENLMRVLASSVTSDTPTAVAASDVRLACAPIVTAGALAGAVLVAAEEKTGFGDADLLRLGSLLADAIADQLSRSADEQRGALHQISALYDLLQAAIATGSEREVIRTFAEALSVWEDTEVLAYRADLQNRFMLMMALPGSDPAAVPPMLAREPILEGPPVLRLAPDERSSLGFAADGDTILARLITDAGRWLIALNSAPGTAKGERSEMYVAALGHALNSCLAVESSRLTWGIMQQFVDRDHPGDAARRALDELCRAVHASGSFIVSRMDRERVLVVGDPPADQISSALTDAQRLRAAIAAPAPFVAWLDLHAAAGRSFSPHEVRLFDAGVASFSAWLPSTIGSLAPGERRRVVRSFEQVVDRYVREAHESRDVASFVLISTGADGVDHDATSSWIRSMRARLRPTDLAGRLATGELGILLLQTPSSGAQIVARRLSRMLPTPALSMGGVRIGVATQRDDVRSGDALIARARQQPIEPVTAR